jgi:hypothetical protein
LDFRDVAAEAIKLAKTAGTVLPGLAAGAAIAEKIIGVVEALRDKATDATTQEELQAAADELRQKVSNKANATADRLDGGDGGGA